MNTYNVLLEGGIDITVDANSFTYENNNKIARFYDKNIKLISVQSKVESVELSKKKIETEEKDVDEYTQYEDFVKEHISNPKMTIRLAKFILDFTLEVENHVKHQKMLRDMYSNLQDKVDHTLNE